MLSATVTTCLCRWRFLCSPRILSASACRLATPLLIYLPLKTIAREGPATLLIKLRCSATCAYAWGQTSSKGARLSTLSSTAPGWYPDEASQGTRYWDGGRWTDAVRPPRKRFAAEAKHSVWGIILVVF